MNLKIALAAASLTLAATAASSDASASWYPPDYVSCGVTDNVTTGPFELIKQTTNYGDHAKLTIAYRGYLRDYYPDDEINFYVKLNGNDALIGASSGSHDDAYVLLISGPRDCYMCIDYQAAPGSECAEYIAGGGQSATWLCHYETPVEEDLFYWAFDEYNHQNAWDIELAAEANGWWDSNYGANYYARFEPRNACY